MHLSIVTDTLIISCRYKFIHQCQNYVNTWNFTSRVNWTDATALSVKLWSTTPTFWLSVVGRQAFVHQCRNYVNTSNFALSVKLRSTDTTDIAKLSVVGCHVDRRMTI